MRIVKFTHGLARGRRPGSAHLLEPAGCLRRLPQLGRMAKLREWISLNPPIPIRPT
jgi:hypothetical protein